MKRIRIPSSLMPKANTSPPRDPFLTTSATAFDMEQAVEAEVEEINHALQQMSFFTSSQVTQADTSPVNKPLLDRAEAYEAEIVGMLANNIVQVREFFLTQVLPLMMASHNGLADAVDVVKTSLGEEPQAAQYIQFFNTVLREALKAKTINFVQELTHLSKDELPMFLAAFDQSQAPAQKGQPDGLTQYLTSVLREVQQVHSMSRSLAKDAKALMRRLPADEADSLAPRSRRAAARTKRK